MAETHKGSCYCGAVAIETSGSPEAMGYCHCDACRTYSGAPMAAFTLWKTDAVKVTGGEELLGYFQSSDFSHRRYCTKCGGRVMNQHPSIGLIDISPAQLPSVAFQAGVHLNYEEAVLPVKDGLPKLRDFPAEVGGTGEVMAE